MGRVYAKVLGRGRSWAKEFGRLVQGTGVRSGAFQGARKGLRPGARQVGKWRKGTYTCAILEVDVK